MKLLWGLPVHTARGPLTRNAPIVSRAGRVIGGTLCGTTVRSGCKPQSGPYLLSMWRVSAMTSGTKSPTLDPQCQPLSAHLGKCNEPTSHIPPGF